jgi:hypothetical protein
MRLMRKMVYGTAASPVPWGRASADAAAAQSPKMENIQIRRRKDKEVQSNG